MRKLLESPLAGRVADHKGQTTVLFLALIGACVATFLIVFNVGQLTSEKEKLANTADAAAYSAAMTEARSLNFEAYLNRGAVANEVFIAQVVSFDSWINYLDSFAQNVSTVTSWIPYVNSITAEIANVASTVTSAVNSASGVAVGVADTLGYKVLPTLVEIAHGATYLAMMDVAKSVVAQNVTTFGGRADAPAYITAGGYAQLILNENAWKNFSKKPGSAAVPAQVVLDSRDGFSNTRNGGGLLDITFPFWVKLRKNGGTVLSSNYKRWDAQDFYGISSWSWRNMSWGSPSALAEGDASADEQSSSNSPYSRSFMAKVNDMKGFHGIPQLRDIANPGPTGPKTSLYFLIEVGKDNGNIKTSSNSSMGAGDLNMPENLSGGRLTAASKAAVSFQRPSDSNLDKTAKLLFRSDGATNGYVEYGSLYSPYWQVSLVPVTLGDKAALAAADNISSPGAAAHAVAVTPFTP